MHSLCNTSVVHLHISVLKGWGLHPLNELATLAEVLEQFKRGEIEECSIFVFPNTLLEQPFNCCITPNLSGPFQTVFRCAQLCPSVHAFCHYVAFGLFFKNGFCCVLLSGSNITNYYLKITSAMQRINGASLKEHWAAQRNQVYKQQYQRLQHNTGLKYKMGFFS